MDLINDRQSRLALAGDGHGDVGMGFGNRRQRDNTNGLSQPVKVIGG